ncbi:YoaK family protein [Mycolicibacterium komossense]|uniref:DUF1275 domain-containing protein n=1 Tax=Mycolicibacterium komossense TaxID=1779 RepID=A0ABT3CEK0_9MYCO|nr:YoaK family protein [Mycolicibacterium komossense]MCV7227900.1 DUF1275 domain-containing protein [Mycolicibacterium komossense]
MASARFLHLGLSGPRWPVAVAAALTFGTGALDVLTLTHLGGVFASVMTGNLALMGLGVARLDTGILIHTAIAVASYIVGVALGTRIVGVDREVGALWPRRVTVTLAVQLAVLVGLAIGWVLTRAAPAGNTQLALLAAAAGSMGMQSAAMRGLGAAVATTYLTGTLTSLIAGWLGRPGPHSDTAGVASLVAAVAGAAGGGLLLLTVPIATPLLTVAPLVVVLATAGYRHGSATGL